MIKTVSFAPPRSARAAKAASKSASKPAPAQPVRVAGAAALAAKQPARASSGSSLAPLAEEKAASPRRAAKKIAPESATQPNLFTTDEAMTAEVAPAETVAKAVAPKKKRATKTTAPAGTTATPATSQAEIAPVTETPAKNSVKSATVKAAEPIEVAPIESKVEPPATPKIKRSRAPKDLALQYGAAPETEVAPRPVVEKTAPRKRLTREAKAARSQMLRPDDDVLQRLQQANAVEVKKPASRGRGWEFECGCCGRVTRFQTPAGICECGAIAVKE